MITIKNCFKKAKEESIKKAFKKKNMTLNEVNSDVSADIISTNGMIYLNF